jgi:cyclophilin family peptidyl-prolyl cis-trans isomerase
MTLRSLLRGFLAVSCAGLFLIASSSAQEPADGAKAEDAKKDRPQSETKKEPGKQEEDKPAAKPEAGKKSPAKSPAAEEKGGSEPKVAAGNAQEGAGEFNALLTQWRNVVKDLRAIKQKHLTATPEEAKALEAQWREKLAEGEQFLPKLRAAGMKAYAASKEDRNIERFLLQVLDDDMAHDQYENAAALSQSLLEAGCEVKKVLDQAGVAAFCTNEFDLAEKYLTDAKNAGVLSQDGGIFLSLVPEYKEYWQREKELREKEAAATGNEQLPRIKVSTTKGDMVIELFENEAPGAVGNFISLVEKNFYDGLTFHRVLPGFMVQGGCPKGDGTGGPGYNIYCECYQPNHRKHFRGTLSMAHAGKDTGGSQFFITFVPTAHLNGKHTAFGRVIEGMDVLGRIQRVNPEEKSEAQTEPDRIEKIEVLRKRDHEYKPSKVQ